MDIDIFIATLVDELLTFWSFAGLSGLHHTQQQ